MNLVLSRIPEWCTDKATVGTLYLEGNFECFILEDVCRESPPGSWKPELKVKGATAIPYGVYTVIINYSNRFSRPLPLLLAVPNFEGIRIHPGNSAADTEGCLLPGLIRTIDRVQSSQLAFGQLYRKLHAVHETEKITLTIKRGN
jgi:hypothetical protein